jgi:hypothetical protein
VANLNVALSATDKGNFVYCLNVIVVGQDLRPRLVLFFSKIGKSEIVLPNANHSRTN